MTSTGYPIRPGSLSIPGCHSPSPAPPPARTSWTRIASLKPVWAGPKLLSRRPAGAVSPRGGGGGGVASAPGSGSEVARGRKVKKKKNYLDEQLLCQRGKKDKNRKIPDQGLICINYRLICINTAPLFKYSLKY